MKCVICYILLLYYEVNGEINVPMFGMRTHNHRSLVKNAMGGFRQLGHLSYHDCPSHRNSPCSGLMFAIISA